MITGSFSRRFAVVLKEGDLVDMDSFDCLIPMGCPLYGNMPLVEPQSPGKSAEDFAAVIDTSMSCSGELVQRF